MKQHIPSEMHLYEKGSHGFGTKKLNITTDTWMDRLIDWLKQKNLLTQSTRKEVNKIK